MRLFSCSPGVLLALVVPAVVITSVPAPATAVPSRTAASPAAAVPSAAAARAAVQPVEPRLQTVRFAATPSAGSRAALRTAAQTAELAATRTRPYSTVGVTWRRTDGDSDVAVEVRTRSLAGAWSGWQALPEQHDEGPDGGGRDAAGATRRGTTPYYAGPSDGVQARVRAAAPVRDLRVDLIDPGTAPDTAPARRFTTAAAYGAAPTPGVVSRQQWGADESIKTCFSGYTGAPKAGYVHHTAGTNVYRPEESAAIIRGIYGYHVKSNGWCDIGYQFLVDKFGVVFEGRGGGIDRNPLGAHAAGFNSNTVGVGLMGSFQSVNPPPVMISALESVLAWKLASGYADPTGTTELTAGTGSTYPARTTVSLNVVSGHRDTSQTTCPGARTYEQLPQIRERVRALIGAGLVTPTASATWAPVGGAPVQVQAGLLQPADWKLDVQSTATGQVVRTISGRADARIETAWDLRDAQGAPVPIGRYALTLTGTGAAGPMTAWTATLQVGEVAPVVPAPVATPPGPATPGMPVSPGTPAPSPSEPTGAGYLPVAPTRILDTRSGTGAARAPLGAQGSLDLRVLGVAGIPSTGVTAVALNLTGTRPTARTHLTVHPAGSARPSTSVLNLQPGQTTASAVVAAVGPDGRISVYNQAGATHVIGDVVGYWTNSASAGRYHPVSPTRLLDTRTDGGRLGPAAVRSVQVGGRAGVPPSGATGAILNVTAVEPSRPGYLTVSAGAPRPRTSNVNFPAAKVVANRVITALSGSGQVEVYNTTGYTHVLVDVVGWYAPPSVPGGTTFTAAGPDRILDTRVGTGAVKGPVGTDGSLSLQVTGDRVPNGAAAVVLTLTATGASSATHITAWPTGASRPGTSDLNLLAGETVPNLAVVPLGADGALQLYNANGRTHLIADVVGYYR